MFVRLPRAEVCVLDLQWSQKNPVFVNVKPRPLHNDTAGGYRDRTVGLSRAIQGLYSLTSIIASKPGTIILLCPRQPGSPPEDQITLSFAPSHPLVPIPSSCLEAGIHHKHGSSQASVQDGALDEILGAAHIR